MNSTESSSWGKGPENKQSIPKIIWLYWDPIKKSPLTDICIKQIQTLHPDYDINILNKNTLKAFIPNIPGRREDLSFANYSDIIRLALLKKYGGIWVDASTFVTKKFDWILDLKEQYQTDVIGFYADSITSDFKYPILENWFLAATEKNYFIKAWHNEFLNCYTSDNPKDYYKFMSKEWLQGMDKGLANYLLPYLSAIKIMREDDRFRILMIPSSESAHFYNFGLQLKPHQLAEEFLLNENAVCNLPMIKFERRGREAVDNYIRKGLLSKESLLYRLAPQSSKKYTEANYKIRYCAYILNNILKKLMRQS